MFSYGSYLEQLPVRIGEFGDLIVGNFLGLPLTVALMLTGMLAQRAGWLQQRDARAWRTASTLGLLIGLPAALLYGYWMLSDIEAYGLAATPQGAMVPMLLSVTLSFLYASVFLRKAPPAWIALLAPAGRMPLTNYLLQSIAMGALLSGWGLALGPRLSYWQTAAVAVLIVVFQSLLSSLWLGSDEDDGKVRWRRCGAHGPIAAYLPHRQLEPQTDLDCVACRQSGAGARFDDRVDAERHAAGASIVAIDRQRISRLDARFTGCWDRRWVLYTARTVSRPAASRRQSLGDQRNPLQTLRCHRARCSVGSARS